MKVLDALLTLASAAEAGARFALGDVPFGVLFVAIALAFGALLLGEIGRMPR